jgi:hypothetical protein
LVTERGERKREVRRGREIRKKTDIGEKGREKRREQKLVTK